MVQCHWDSFNTFEHYGSGDFDMMGWDALNMGTLPMFHFEDIDAVQMRDQLLNSMPAELYALIAENPITVGMMHQELANKTAARFSDLDKVVIELAQRKEFDILKPDGKLRSRMLTRLDPKDRIAIPTMRLFPGFSCLR